MSHELIHIQAEIQRLESDRDRIGRELSRIITTSTSSFKITSHFTRVGKQYLLECTGDRLEGDLSHSFYFYIDLVQMEPIKSIYILSEEENQIMNEYLKNIKII